MKNSGNKTIRNLALMNNKKNKSRSILVFIVILLSTALLTAITSYGVGLVKYEKLSSEDEYGRFEGMLKNITDEDLDKVLKDENFTEIGLMYGCGSVESDATISLKALDKTARDLFCMESRILSGTYPENSEEILVSEGVLRSCGIENAEIGENIALNVRLDESRPYEPMEFSICGFYRDGDENTDAYNAFVSEDFYKDYCRIFERDFSALFNVSDDMELDFSNAEEILKDYVVSLGLRETQVSVNSMYILLVLNPGKEVLLICVFLILLVVFFSMIVIYNIFQISLVQRMQEYGRLKALGTTRKQIRKLINLEGVMIALPAIPLGALTGYLLSAVSFRWVVGTVNNLQSKNITGFSMFSPAAILGSMVLAFATVWLALIKPKRKISKISAIEAMDFRESTGTRRKKRSKSKTGEGMRKGRESVNEFSLALANLAANKKQTIIYGWSHFMEDSGAQLGDDIEYSMWNGQESRSFSSKMTGSFGSLTGGWAITEDTYEHFGYEPASCIGKIWVDCSEADRAEVEAAVRDLISSRKHLELETYEQNYKEQMFGTRVIRWSIYSFLVIISFIGFMNMVNTMIITIITKRREYGVMQAVGMTGKQLNRSLILQGLIYTGGTLVISLIAGIPLGYLAFVKLKSISGFGMNVYHFPIVEVIIMTAVISSMQLILSWVLSRNVKQDSLVERIRY